MQQANVSEDAWDLKMWMSPKYPAYFLNCWNDMFMGRLKELGYKNMRSTWMHHNLFHNHDRERLLDR